MVLNKRHVWLALASLLTGLTLAAVTLSSQAQQDESSDKVVFVVPVKGMSMLQMIDLGIANLVERAIDEAERQGASALIFEIDTFGGRVDSATQIRDAIFATDIKTIAFIKNRAISAGALIALACQHIVVAPGSSIGAATPVAIPIGPTAGEVQSVSEKEVSYVRTEFAATAERNGHNPLLAKAMVDSDVELYTRTTDSGVAMFEVRTKDEFLRSMEAVGEVLKTLRNGTEDADAPTEEGELLIGKGKLLTLSADQALTLGLAEHEASRVGHVLSLYNLSGARVERIQLNWSEVLARFLTNPIVSGMLLTFGFLGIMYELKIPGWGISGTIGLICLGLFFGAHLLVGLAEWAELLLFAVGIALLVAEIFFIPGFGIAGISGIACLVLAIYLALVKSPIPRYSWEYEQFRLAIYTFFWVTVALPVIVILTWKLLPRTPFYARIVQVGEGRADLGFTAGSTESYMGKVGRAVTILRPAGRARFGGRLVDVVAEGEFISPDTQVRVIDVKGNRIVVIPDQEVETS